MKLFVGSTNPVKLNAVTTAASETWPDVVVESRDVPSGVASQPMTDVETRTGARNRALAALDEGLQLLDDPNLPARQKFKPSEALGIGLEGGVFELDGELWSTVWVAVVDAEENIFESNGARFKIPDLIAQPILRGEEMGPVVNKLFGGKDVRRTNGAIGVVTNNFVDRTEEYGAIAKMALGLWYGRDWDKQLR